MLKRLIKLAGSSFIWGMDRLTDGLRQLAGRSPQRRFVVLYYHGVLAEEKVAFERQMDFLTANATPAACDTQHLNGRSRYAAVTFDDAFVSVRDHALPILKERKIPATIFVPTGYLGTTPGWIKKAARQSRSETVMSAEEIRALASDPIVTIGSHTITHPNVSKLPADPALMELRESKLELEKIIGKPVDLFSFPHGEYTARDLELARKVGYRRVFGIHPALASPQSEFLIGRVAVNPWDWPIEFRLKLAGAYRWLTWITPARQGN